MLTRRRLGFIAGALALAAVLSACNPTNETVAYRSGTVAGASTNYTYSGPEPAWIQVRVAEASANEVRAFVSAKDLRAVCVADIGWGLETPAPCHVVNQSLRANPSRALRTEGVNRGWKRMIAVNPGTTFRVHVGGRDGGNETVKLEIAIVDGNGTPIGDMTVTPPGPGSGPGVFDFPPILG
jgi:hypothetical protein